MKRVPTALLLIGIVLASACEPEPKPSSQDQISPAGITEPVESTLEHQESQVEHVTTAGSVVNEVEPRLLDRCVDYVQFQVYVGDAAALAIWDRAGRSADGLRTECQILALADESTVRLMSDEMDRLDAFVAADLPTSTTTTTTTTPPQLVVAPAPAPVGDCDPNYTGCVPVASDVDCEGGTGNGPAYVGGPVQVVGNDIYGLDRDGNGVGCD